MRAVVWAITPEQPSCLIPSPFGHWNSLLTVPSQDAVGPARPTETTTLSLTEAKLASRPCPGDPKYTYRIKYLSLYSAIRQEFLAAKSV